MNLSDRIGPAVGPGAGRQLWLPAFVAAIGNGVDARSPSSTKPAPKAAGGSSEAGACSRSRPRRSSLAAPGQQAGAEQPQLMYSPWMKVCGKGPDTNNKQVCVIAKDGRLENGMPVAIVQLIRAGRRARKLLRVTVPLGMQLAHGTR